MAFFGFLITVSTVYPSPPALMQALRERTQRRPRKKMKGLMKHRPFMNAELALAL